MGRFSLKIGLDSTGKDQMWKRTSAIAQKSGRESKGTEIKAGFDLTKLAFAQGRKFSVQTAHLEDQVLKRGANQLDRVSKSEKSEVLSQLDVNEGVP